MIKTTAGFAAAAALFAATAAHAEIATETVTYDVDGQTYEGYFAANTAVEDAPVVVIVHDWDGLGDYEKRRAEMLAERGYSAFAVDVYGQGVRPTTTADSRAESGKLYEDREALRARLEAGLEQARQKAGENAKLGAIGYCFGGAAVLEMARAGMQADGFVTFHAGLQTPEGQDYSQASAPLLIQQGSADPVAPMDQVAALAQELNDAGAAYDMAIYGGAEHSFTVWDSDDYLPDADVQSWDAMLTFFDARLK